MLRRRRRGPTPHPSTCERGSIDGQNSPFFDPEIARRIRDANGPRTCPPVRRRARPQPVFVETGPPGSRRGYWAF